MALCTHTSVEPNFSCLARVISEDNTHRFFASFALQNDGIATEKVELLHRGSVESYHRVIYKAEEVLCGAQGRRQVAVHHRSLPPRRAVGLVSSSLLLARVQPPPRPYLVLFTCLALYEGATCFSCGRCVKAGRCDQRSSVVRRSPFRSPGDSTIDLHTVL